MQAQALASFLVRAATAAPLDTQTSLLPFSQLFTPVLAEAEDPGGHRFAALLSHLAAEARGTCRMPAAAAQARRSASDDDCLDGGSSSDDSEPRHAPYHC